MDEIDAEMERIRAKSFEAMSGKPLWAIVEIDGGYAVYEHSRWSVYPVSAHQTKREAAARVLQLLGVGPVAPQTHPEEACIS